MQGLSLKALHGVLTFRWGLGMLWDIQFFPTYISSKVTLRPETGTPKSQNSAKIYHFLGKEANQSFMMVIKASCWKTLASKPSGSVCALANHKPVDHIVACDSGRECSAQRAWKSTPPTPASWVSASLIYVLGTDVDIGFFHTLFCMSECIYVCMCTCVDVWIYR